MGRRRPGRFQFTDQLPPEFVLAVLKGRAGQRAKERKHTLGTWLVAKKQHGKGALQASCQTCHAKVVVMPHGPRDEVSRRGTPSMRGEAVFEECR